MGMGSGRRRRRIRQSNLINQLLQMKGERLRKLKVEEDT